MTLERHIDHITRQLEQAHKHQNTIAEERDQLQSELDTFKGVTMNQEQARTEMQRAISRFENEKLFHSQQEQEFKQEIENLKSHLNAERSRYNELEQVITLERKGLHEYDLQIQDLQRQNE